MLKDELLERSNMNEKLSFKETLFIIGLSILSTPLLYLIVTAPFGWWIR